MKPGKKNIGLIIFVILLAAVIAGCFIVDAISNRTKLSKAGIMGNTAGNLYNQGLFCDDGERIWFSNLNDQGMLYSMDYSLNDFKIINTDVARYINTDENYVYYSRMNNLKDKAARSIFIFFSNGIFRTNKNGKNLTMLWNKPIGSLLSYDNNLYYQYYNENEKLSIHRLSIDGEKDFELFADDTPAVSLYNSKLYYAGFNKDRNLHSVGIMSGEQAVELEGGFFNPIVAYGEVYYIDLNDGYSIKHINLDGSSKETLVDDRCSTYNISSDGRYIYYQCDNGHSNGIYRLELSSGTSEKIMDGDYKWINTVQDKCFFVSFDESTTYVYTNGSGAEMFTAPVLSE